MKRRDFFKVAAGASAVAAMTLPNTGCAPFTMGLNPLLTLGLTQNLFAGMHLDTFGLSMISLATGNITKLLQGRRALGIYSLLVSALLLSKLDAQQRKALAGTTRLYVTLDNNTLAVINPADGTVLTTIPLGTSPTQIAASPEGDFLAISNTESDSVSIVSTIENRLLRTIMLPAQSFPYGIAVADQGSVYVVSEARNTLSVLDAVAGRVLTTLSLSNGASQVAVSPDSTLVWAPTSSGNIHVFDTLTNTPSITITGVAAPTAVAFNPTGTRAFITSAPQNAPGSLVVFDTNDYKILTRIPVGTNPYNVSVSPGGSRVYVSNFDSNTISVIDVASAQVVSTIETGKAPIGTALA